MKLVDLKQRMEEFQVRSKKSLGQNFLVSEVVTERIVEAIRSAAPACLVEVGPGLGALTEPLTDLRPLLIELDRDLAALWRERGFSVIENDALKVDWESLPLSENAWLVSNLPYQISSSLLVDRCFGPTCLQGMVLMFQKEVAARLTARPRSPEYGLLSVLAQLYWQIEKVSDASPRDFHPPPKVASRVLRFLRRSDDLPDRGFLTFVKVAFGHRRKFLLKNLGQLGHKTNWPELLEEQGISLKARAEELSPQQFADLYRRWKSK